MPLTDPTRDLDFVLTRDVTQYREEFPYPWWLDGPHYNPPWVAPLHFYLAFLTIAVVVTAIRSICYKTIFQWIINFFEVAQDDQAELRESLSQLIYYTISWTWCAVWVMQQDFFWDTVYIWEGDFPFQPLPWTVYWLYAFNLGWYAHCTYAHFTWDNHKSDFWEMLIHHVVTLVLLYFSFVNGYWRLGCLVLYTHDVCDIFLHFAKACKFTIEKTLPDFVMTCIFVPFPLSWVVFRLILFPAMYVIYTTLFHPLQLVGWEYSDYYLFFNPLLIVLFFIQVYWGVLILKIVVRKIRGKPLEDIRQDNVRLREKEE